MTPVWLVPVLGLARETIDVLTAAVGVPAALAAVALLTWVDLTRDRGADPGRRLLIGAVAAVVTLLLVVGLRFAGLRAT